MANRIKGITVEIGGDTTKLQTALKGVNSEIRNTQSQLKDVEKLLKLDPGNTELLAQRHRLLGDAVNETKEKLETLKTAAEQANEALANGEISQEQYDALQREIIETENALEELERQSGESATALQKIAASGEKLQTVGASIESAGKKMLPVTGGIIALGAAAVKTSADFDTAMSKVAAVSGATGADFDKLREKAREMGAKTKFSASEAADAMNYMAMAGWKTGDMLSGIEGIMNLAAASGEDLATTSDIVTDALTALGMTAADSGHFADIMAAASSNANTNVAMMGETFKYCAPVAGALGYTAEDVAEAIGLMANAGIKSSQAGTAMRTMLTKLQGDIKLTGTNFGEVTIATTNADGSMRELGEILGDLRGYFTQMTESEAAATAETLVGKNAMSGFLAVMNAAPGDIEKLNTAILNCDGTSEKMAATMQDNLAGQLTILKSQLEELAISFGDLLMPAIRQIVSWIQGFVDKLNGMDEGTRKVIITIALFVAAIAPILIVVGKVIGAVGTIMTIVPKIAGVISTVKTAFAALNTTMLANPIFLIIAAIAALVAAFIYLWNNCDGFRQFWIDLWENIKEVAIAIWEGLKEFFSAAWEAIVGVATSIWEGLKSFFSGIWNGIKTIFTTVLDAIKTAVTTAFNTCKTVIIAVINAIKTVIETVWNAIKAVVTTVVNAISSFLTAAWNTIKTVVTTVFTAIQTVFTTIWNTIRTVITTVVSAISGFLTTAWNAIKTTITTVITAIQTVISTVWNAIKSVITAVVNSIKSTITTVWNGIKNTISTVVNGIKTTVSTVFNAVWNGIKNTVSGIYNTVKTGFDNAVNFIKNLATSAFKWGSDIISGIVDGIKSCIGKIKDAVKSVADTIRSFLHFSVPDEGPLTDYESWMPDFMGGLAKGIEKSRGLVAKAVSGVASDMVINPKVGFMEEFASIGQSASMDRETVDGMISAITNAVQQLSHPSGDIVIPVYIGGTLLDEVVVGAQARQNLRSGGR